MPYISFPLETDPDALAQDAFDYLQAKQPLWTPHDSQLDTWIIAANARMASTLRDTASDVADSIFRYMGKLVNIPPLEATAATTTVTFNITDNAAGRLIPGGFYIGIPDQDGVLQELQVAFDQAIPAGTLVVAGVSVVAVEDGAAASGLGVAGDTLTPLDEFAWIDSIILDAPTANGTDAEEDDVYLSRLSDNLSLMGPHPVLPNDFAIIARNIATVWRALAIDLFNPASTPFTGNTTNGSPTITGMSSQNGVTIGSYITGAGIPVNARVTALPTGASVTIDKNATATAAGVAMESVGSYNNERSITVVAIDENGDDVDPTVLAAIIALLQSMREATFAVNGTTSTVTDIDVQFDVDKWDGWDSPDLVSRVTDAIINYYNKSTWGMPPFGDVRLWYNQPLASINNLKAVIGAVEGVKNVNSVTQRTGADAYAATDINLPGAAPLAEAGVVTGTVN